MKPENRRGIACAGNWIVDHVKIIDVWPSPSNLANILSEEKGTGGCPFNCLIDLARLAPGLPLEAIGLIGEDDDAQWIRDQIAFSGADASGLLACPAAPTSYTDVMTLRDDGTRTFFHLRGANELFDIEHVNVEALRSRIFHLGYLMLLTRLDQPDEAHGSRAARLLARCREAGLRTSIDLVSAEVGRYAEIVTPALRVTDYAIINEVEAQAVTGLRLRSPSGEPDWDALEAAARRLADLGVAGNATIHLPEGAVSLDVAAGRMHTAGSLRLPPGFIKGAAGAGDAFCSGMLLGLHEGWPVPRCLEMAHAAAAASLRHATCTQGVRSAEEALELARRYPAS